MRLGYEFRLDASAIAAELENIIRLRRRSVRKPRTAYLNGLKIVHFAARVSCAQKEHALCQEPHPEFQQLERAHRPSVIPQCLLDTNSHYAALNSAPTPDRRAQVRAVSTPGAGWGGRARPAGMGPLPGTGTASERPIRYRSGFHYDPAANGLIGTCDVLTSNRGKNVAAASWHDATIAPTGTGPRGRAFCLRWAGGGS